MTQKLPRILLLHFALVILGLYLTRADKLIIFLFFGHGGRVHDSQNQLFLCKALRAVRRAVQKLVLEIEKTQSSADGRGSDTPWAKARPNSEKA